MRRVGTQGQGHHPLYARWNVMHQRCSNPKSGGYRFYGARGIRVCERWNSFEAFLEDVGEMPSPQHTLDRIDNEGNYEPGNVRWASRCEQARNRRSTAQITINGETKCLKAWALERGLNYGTVKSRYQSGWPVERLFDAPTRERNP